MKLVKDFFKGLTLAFLVIAIGLFFLPFAKISFTSVSSITVRGFELLVGAEKTIPGFADPLSVFKSGWFMVGFFFAVISAVVSGFGFRKKGAGFAPAVLSLITGITMLVLVLGKSAQYVDIGSLTQAGVTGVTMTIFAVLSCVALFAAVLSQSVAIIVADRIAVLESNGKKKSIPKRVVRFALDYKNELKKITWPTMRTVAKNTVVVIVVSLLIGAFIWLLDWGLAELLQLILGVEL